MCKLSSGPLLSIDTCNIKMILLVDSEGPDQTARMRRLIWAFTVRICPTITFTHGMTYIIWSNGTDIGFTKVDIIILTVM